MNLTNTTNHPTAVERALLDSSSNPAGTTPHDSSVEAARLREARAEIADLCAATDAGALRRKLAGQLLLCEALAVRFALKSGERGSPAAQAGYAGVALRALNVSSRLVVAMAALTPTPIDAIEQD